MPTFLILAVLVIAIALAALIAPAARLDHCARWEDIGVSGFLYLPRFCRLAGTGKPHGTGKANVVLLSCHIMGQYGKSLYVDDPSYIPASHFQNGRVPHDQACYTCHTDYSMFGGFRAKLGGLHHIYVQYVTGPQQPLKLYHPFNNRECLHCHEGSRSFEQGVMHTAKPQTMADIKSNKLSCMTAGCHDTVHNVKELDHVKFWKPVQ